MNRKKSNSSGGLVYSTDPDFKIQQTVTGRAETIEPAAQKLKLRLDTKHRAGKAVTLITGFIGADADLTDLGKKMKSFCGTGGSVKDGEIIVQGDHRDKLLQWLLKNGYQQSKKQ